MAARSNAPCMSVTLAQVRTQIADRPQFVEAYVNWGNVLSETGQTAQARSLYQKAIALRPDDAEAEYRLGSLEANANDLDAAIPHFRRAIELRPGFAPAEANLGLARSSSP